MTLGPRPRPLALGLSGPAKFGDGMTCHIAEFGCSNRQVILYGAPVSKPQAANHGRRGSVAVFLMTSNS